MSKLGEARLGSTQFATPAPFEIDEHEVRERAEEHVKTPFPTQPGTMWDKFLSTILHELEIQNETIGDIIDQRFITTATQYQLDMIGEMWGLERRPGEDDDHFRARIKLQLPRHTSDATIDLIVAVCAQLLDTDESRITVLEPHPPIWQFDDIFDEEGEASLPIDWRGDDLPDDFDDWDEEDQEEWFDLQIGSMEQQSEPARIDVHVEEIVFHDAGIDIDDLEELLYDVRAAGVKVNTTIGYQFTHRSVDDYSVGINNEDKAYDGYDTDTIEQLPDEPDQLLPGSERLDIGGPYADEITALL